MARSEQRACLGDKLLVVPHCFIGHGQRGGAIGGEVDEMWPVVRRRDVDLAEVLRGEYGRIHQLLERTTYVGPAPVTLDHYKAVIKAQAISEVRVGPKDVREAMSDLVLTGAPHDASESSAILTLFVVCSRPYRPRPQRRSSNIRSWQGRGTARVGRSCSPIATGSSISFPA